MPNDKKKYSEKLRHPKWQRKRLEIFNRDDFACLNCDDTETELAVHHKEYSNDDPWKESSENLMTLCKNCHTRAHHLLTNEKHCQRAIEYALKNDDLESPENITYLYYRYLTEMKGEIDGVFYVDHAYDFVMSRIEKMEFTKKTDLMKLMDFFNEKFLSKGNNAPEESAKDASDHEGQSIGEVADYYKKVANGKQASDYLNLNQLRLFAQHLVFGEFREAIDKNFERHQPGGQWTSFKRRIVKMAHEKINNKIRLAEKHDDRELILKLMEQKNGLMGII